MARTTDVLFFPPGPLLLSDGPSPSPPSSSSPFSGGP